MAELDLSLLRALDALLRERQVTRAARRLGLTQSAMSHALQRLRDLFGDPLFVRSPRGIVPTPRALQLGEALARVLTELARLTEPPEVFNPARLQRRFCLVSSDYADVVLLPALLRRLSLQAPACDLEVRPFVAPDLEEALEDGRVDLAIGVFPKMSACVMQQRLFSDEFVCLLREGHPAQSGPLTPARFAALAHLQIAPRGAPGGPVDDELARLGLTRRVALRIGSFLTGPQLVAQSDLVLTAPERLVRSLSQPGLRTLRPPLKLPTIHIYQIWHERRQQDPAHAWLRGCIAASAEEV